VLHQPKEMPQIAEDKHEQSDNSLENNGATHQSHASSTQRSKISRTALRTKQGGSRIPKSDLESFKVDNFRSLADKNIDLRSAKVIPLDDVSVEEAHQYLGDVKTMIIEPVEVGKTLVPQKMSAEKSIMVSKRDVSHLQEAQFSHRVGLSNYEVKRENDVQNAREEPVVRNNDRDNDKDSNDDGVKVTTRPDKGINWKMCLVVLSLITFFIGVAAIVKHFCFPIHPIVNSSSTPIAPSFLISNERPFPKKSQMFDQLTLDRLQLLNDHSLLPFKRTVTPIRNRFSKSNASSRFSIVKANTQKQAPLISIGVIKIITRPTKRAAKRHVHTPDHSLDVQLSSDHTTNHIHTSEMPVQTIVSDENPEVVYLEHGQDETSVDSNYANNEEAVIIPEKVDRSQQLAEQLNELMQKMGVSDDVDVEIKLDKDEEESDDDVHLNHRIGSVSNSSHPRTLKESNLPGMHSSLDKQTDPGNHDSSQMHLLDMQPSADLVGNTLPFEESSNRHIRHDANESITTI
jgi:hypothetical protein